MNYRSIKKIGTAIDRAIVHKERLNLQGPNVKRLTEGLFMASEAIRQIEKEWSSLEETPISDIPASP